MRVKCLQWVFASEKKNHTANMVLSSREEPMYHTSRSDRANLVDYVDISDSGYNTSAGLTFMLVFLHRIRY